MNSTCTVPQSVVQKEYFKFKKRQMITTKEGDLKMTTTMAR